jgi:hypothetical protein
MMESHFASALSLQKSIVVAVQTFVACIVPSIFILEGICAFALLAGVVLDLKVELEQSSNHHR